MLTVDAHDLREFGLVPITLIGGPLDGYREAVRDAEPVRSYPRCPGGRWVIGAAR